MASASKAAYALPGRVLGLRAQSSSDLIRQVERGFRYDLLRSLETHSGINITEIAALIGIPERTLARRRAAGRLTSDESERLLRVSAIYEKALELFEGDGKAALNWLNTPKRAFNEQTPLVYSRTELGAREVENLIGRLEHGVFS